MDFKKAFTPKDTEELKPNFFVKKTHDGYKQVKPLVWNGQWRLRGQIGWRNVLTIVLILALFFSGSKYVNFYEDFHQDPESFCKDYSIYSLPNIGEVVYEDTSSIQVDIVEGQWPLS
ncbi:hypothetical protein LCGC14_0730110 [marine sediment metagenome]|uniref:Uncharacterized protein n=1 Tax=marine sediment metagenome TaxID=412755 RepID=A0A0F9QA29_9ZZZZ